MARTRTTLRRIDPWSMLKFGFVVNLVLLGVELLLALVVWYFVQRLGLIDTICGLAESVGFEDCGVDGGALLDTFLVLGLLGVVIQTGIVVFMTFLANLIFDLTGGIAITLDDGATSSSSTSSGDGGAVKRGIGSLGTLLSGNREEGSDDGSTKRRRGPKPIPKPKRPSERKDEVTSSGRTWPGDRGRDGEPKQDGGSTTSSGSGGLFGDL